ncbi:copper resistance protein B [Alteriqipengyuania sp. WL0013]|uniref:copper resistance protein B n=1 Tax=Alteriqipengyuania sp. WL0013 TaxID=3110773 RepID=UPI002CB1B13D|nr:copper resistance protein B [Alteriqipengyuania sp. WL0013]MEB3416529.1 copper resistance protein B [Alteriqipengyuania sp. WL0013]
MMRSLPILSAAMLISLSAPAVAQDHAQHPPAAPHEMDHCAMGHLPPDQCPPKDADDPHAGHRMEGAIPAQGDPHAGHAMGGAMASVPEAPPPPRAFGGPRHAADAIWGEAAMERAREQLAQENGGQAFGTLMAERLEYRAGDEDLYLWDVQGWYGGDIDRLFLKSEGEGEFGGGLESGEVQALWSHAIGPFFDLQLGARYDFAPLDRTYLVAGVQGLAPYMFEVDAAAFLSDEGDLTARVEAEYDQLITQRLVLQPRIEIGLAAQDVPELDLGSGITKVEAGLRLRYEIAREFAPYVGLSYEAALGRTADFARADGRDPDGIALVAGVRAWF